ncbi:MAG: hypothetical protein COA85_01355 [Robiginitomaculum sp.]|nr:MAG: hypothetical protein COA85_01355 [Robiginitomaculum sp.]
MKPAFWIFLIAAAMSAFLLYMVVHHENLRHDGQEIILDMEPIDPRSLFRGHYVRIQTPLSQLDPEKLQGDDTFKKGQLIYVTIEPDQNGSWNAVSLSHHRPTSPQTFIKGRVKRAHSRLRILYNIESYFADQKTAKGLEEQLADHQMRLIIALSKDGNAVIKGIQIDGERQMDRLW